MKPTIKELKHACQSKQALSREFESWYTNNVSRKVSVYFTWVFVKLKIPVNYVSFLTFITGIISAILIATGKYYYVLAGALLLQLWMIFDKCDGEVARYTKTCNLTGEYIENVSHVIVNPLIFFCLGFGVYLNTNNLIYIWFGFLSAIGFALASYVWVSKNAIWYNVAVRTGGKIKHNKSNKEKEEEKGFMNYILSLPKKLHNILGISLAMILILIGSVFNYVNFTIIGYPVTILEFVIIFYGVAVPVGVLFLIFKSIRNREVDEGF